MYGGVIMNLKEIINVLRKSLYIFQDDSEEEAISMIENNINLVFDKYTLSNKIDFGLIESLASRCYNAKVFTENLSLDDIYYLEDMCLDYKCNYMLTELLKLYNALSAMTNYFNTLDIPLAARDYYHSQKSIIKVASLLISTLKENLVNDDTFEEVAKIITDLYNEKMIDNRVQAKPCFENAIEYTDLFTFESTFCDFCLLKNEILSLSSIDFKLLLNSITTRLDKISDSVSDDILKKIVPLLYKHIDSEEDLQEKEKILIRKVNERI